MTLSRRHALLMALGLGAAPAQGANEKADGSKRLSFIHGVASGDPLSDRVIIWTRLSGANEPQRVRWRIAKDKGFKHIVQHGSSLAEQGSDYTVKIDVGGLEAGKKYYYRFDCLGIKSAIGRTQTLPENTNKVVLAVANCALYPNGYFNAYRAISRLKRVDCVVHLGDYIYEYGAGLDDYGMVNGRKLERIPQPEHEIISLSDYRTRHAQYKSDKDLQAAHARCAWICVFDDHEMCNNPWLSGADNHNPDKGEGDWLVRKAAALKAYSEWMPIRNPKLGALSEAIYRSFRFGTLAELIMLETRLLGRSKQLDYATDMTFTKSLDGQVLADYPALAQKINDDSRTLLGDDQSKWLAQTLKSSVSDGVTWQVLGNQVIMARVPGPNFKAILGAEKINLSLAAMPELARNYVSTFVELFDQDQRFAWNLDAWDGYPAERERLYDMVKDAKARMVVLSGDSHSAWANQLADAKGAHIGVEIGVTAISSPTRWQESIAPDFQLAKAMADQNPEVLACDDNHNGFVRLTLTKTDMTAEWMKVDTIDQRAFTLSVEQGFTAKALHDRVGLLEKG